MYKKTVIIFLYLFPMAACLNETGSKFNIIEKLLISNSIALNNNKIIVYNDTSCDICFKNLEYYINKMPSKDFLFLYISQSSKIKYEQTIVKKFVSKEQFRLLNDKKIVEQLSKSTNDYKGIYVIEIAQNQITNISPVSNF